MSWAESVVYWTNFPAGTPVNVLLSRVPQVLTHLKRKSDYITNPIPKQGLEFIFKKMIEVESVMLTFNPLGGRMAEIPPSEKPFPHRAGNLFKLQYATNWEENGVEAAEKYIELTRKLYAYMTPFVSKSPRGSFLNYRDLDLGISHNGKNSYLEVNLGNVLRSTLKFELNTDASDSGFFIGVGAVIRELSGVVTVSGAKKVMDRARCGCAREANLCLE
ncbi:berberine bridge enzyme-like 8 [Olea europaea subsp. europaea]|uniref:Berberine bridge enzyme-like 8 n=1 Tax=Olea europaea subsp. europaea TaxID=158383 RepID=A0A8S0UPH7_OLEEU|nr:berberine bridge enzyme-like 8 [Olea europaea subsp. europaea]